MIDATFISTWFELPEGNEDGICKAASKFTGKKIRRLEEVPDFYGNPLGSSIIGSENGNDICISLTEIDEAEVEEWLDTFAQFFSDGYLMFVDDCDASVSAYEIDHSEKCGWKFVEYGNVFDLVFKSKEKPMISVVVRDGRCESAFSTKEIFIDTIDCDTDDPERADSAEEEIAELEDDKNLFKYYF